MFGNALYDKSQKNVDRPNQPQQVQQQAPQQLQQPQAQQQSSSDPYAPLYQLGLGIQASNGETIVTGQTYGKQETIKALGFRWDASRKTWYQQVQEAAWWEV